MYTTDYAQDRKKVRSRIITWVILAVIVLGIAALIVIPKLDVPMQKAPNLPIGALLVKDGSSDIMLYIDGKFTKVEGVNIDNSSLLFNGGESWQMGIDNEVGIWLGHAHNLYKVTPDGVVRLSKKDRFIQEMSADGTVAYVISDRKVIRFDAANGTRTRINLHAKVGRNEFGSLERYMTTTDGSRYLWCWGHGPYNEETDEFEETYESYVWYDGKTTKLDFGGRIPLGMTDDGTGFWLTGADYVGLFALINGELHTLDADAQLARRQYKVNLDCRQILYTSDKGTFVSVDFGEPKKISDATCFDWVHDTDFRYDYNDLRGVFFYFPDEMLYLDEDFEPHVVEGVPDSAEWTGCSESCAFLCRYGSAALGKRFNLYLYDTEHGRIELPGDPKPGSERLSPDGKTAYWIARDDSLIVWSDGKTETLLKNASELYMCKDGTLFIWGAENDLYAFREGTLVPVASDAWNVYVRGNQIAYIRGDDNYSLWYGGTDLRFEKIAEGVQFARFIS